MGGVGNISSYQLDLRESCHLRLIQRNSGHDDVIKYKYFPRYWFFVRGIHRSPVNSPHKGQWRGALVFSLICALNKRLSKQSWGWWFETPSRPLWCHCNGNCKFAKLFNASEVTPKDMVKSPIIRRSEILRVIGQFSTNRRLTHFV